MEFVNAIFQDMESFGKREVFETGCRKVLDLGSGKFQNNLKWI